MKYDPDCQCCQSHKDMRENVRGASGWPFCPFCGHHNLSPEEQQIEWKRMDEIRANNELIKLWEWEITELEEVEGE